MACLIISSAAVTAVSRATSSQTRQVVVPFNGTKLSNSAVTQTHASSLVAPFTGLKSNSRFPMSRKVDNITSLSSNGGRAKCMGPLQDTPATTKGITREVFSLTTEDSLEITTADPGSWIPLSSNGLLEFRGQNLENWVEVDVSTLKKGRKYEVIYYVMMKINVVSTFTLTTTFPDGYTETTTGRYTVKPGEYTDVTFKEFRQNFSGGKIKFTLNSDTPSKWVGLIISEVTIS